MEGTVDGVPHDRAPARREPGVLYEFELVGLSLHLGGGVTLDVSDVLGNGRSNYVMFQKLAGLLAGLTPYSEGGAADLVGPDGAAYEVKAYLDPEAHPGTGRKVDAIHTAASATFGPNNLGPVIARLLAAGDYAAALQRCCETGFDRADYYLYTNTRSYTPGTPFRFLILATETILSLLDQTDPRIVSRRALLGQVTRVERIDADTLTL